VQNLNVKNTAENIQLDDIARDLGISKSTVSRAISGKGRVSTETRRRVQDYIKENNYRPNGIARSLANSKTYNIGVVLPADNELTEIPFFQICLIGAAEAAAAADYDVVVTTVSSDDISLLKRIVANKKVDGIILTRSEVNDIPANYLKSTNIPFVTVGSSDDDTLFQIDTDHISACEELTSYILLSGNKATSLLLGNCNHIVNRSRLQGFMNAHKKNGIPLDDSLIYDNLTSNISIERAMNELLLQKPDCIVCGDDYICSRVLRKLDEENLSIPDHIRVASFYNSSYLLNHNPPITAIDINVRELGTVAGQSLINIVEGKAVSKKNLLSYEISIKKSTK
jgi:DNA-binding LacI/PurR family transcriptional regulator